MGWKKWMNRKSSERQSKSRSAKPPLPCTQGRGAGIGEELIPTPLPLSLERFLFGLHTTNGIVVGRDAQRSARQRAPLRVAANQRVSDPRETVAYSLC